VELERKIEASAGESLNSVYERLKDTRLSVHLHCQRGRPSVVISEVAEKTGCQMIVMGTRGNTGLSHVLLGSVTERTLRKAPCSVLTVTARKDQNDKDTADT
jgi:nucleotide-binding universal stress UspA family protein